MCNHERRHKRVAPKSAAIYGQGEYILTAEVTEQTGQIRGVMLTHEQYAFIAFW